MKKILTVVIALLPFVNAADAPQLKEGLWSIHTQTIENPGNKKTETTISLCRDHAYDTHANAIAKGVKGCTTLSESSTAGKRSVNMRCVIGGTTIETKSTTTIDGDTSFHSETHTTYTPAMINTNESTMIVDQKYTGACGAGMNPGDRIDASGRVINGRR